MAVGHSIHELGEIATRLADADRLGHSAPQLYKRYTAYTRVAQRSTGFDRKRAESSVSTGSGRNRSARGSRTGRRTWPHRTAKLVWISIRSRSLCRSSRQRCLEAGPSELITERAVFHVTGSSVVGGGGWVDVGGELVPPLPRRAKGHHARPRHGHPALPRHRSNQMPDIMRRASDGAIIGPWPGETRLAGC